MYIYPHYVLNPFRPVGISSGQSMAQFLHTTSLFHNNKCILKQTEQHHYPQKSLKRKSLGGLCNYSFWRIDSKQTLGRPVSDGHWERWGKKNPVCFIRPPGLPRVPSRCCCCVCLPRLVRRSTTILLSRPSPYRPVSKPRPPLPQPFSPYGTAMI